MAETLMHFYAQEYSKALSRTITSTRQHAGRGRPLRGVRASGAVGRGSCARRSSHCASAAAGGLRLQAAGRETWQLELTDRVAQERMPSA